MKIIEFRHIAPFEGCHWRWEYVAAMRRRSHYIYRPIVWTSGHLELWEIGAHILEPSVSPNFPYYLDFFKDFKVWDWGEELLAQIPAGYFQPSAAFAQAHGLTFTWTCSECGEKLGTIPTYVGDYSGNGGVGIEVWNWLCDQCWAAQTV